ncbi:MAG: deoxyribodipyrimidine photo-lyase, partial [Pseudomonadota bacterium]
MSSSPIILWLRRDLRLGDHEALTAACATGRAVIPLFIHDNQIAALGAAPKMRMGLAIDQFQAALQDRGSRLILRKGKAIDVLRPAIR